MSTPKHLILWTLALFPLGAAVLVHFRGNSPTLSVTRPALPALAFDQYLVDLGAIKPTSEVQANFHFRHRGTQPAKILELKPSCGCLQPRLHKEEYAPGESDVLVLRVYPANEAPGPHEYYVDIKYADPEPRETRVTFRVDLPEKGISVRPPAVMVYQFGEKPTEIPVLITDTRQESWSVHGISVSLPFVNVTAEAPSRTETQAWELPLKVTVAAKVPSGRHHGLVTVFTDSPDYPELKIPLMIHGPPDYTPDTASDATEEHSVP